MNSRRLMGLPLPPRLRAELRLSHLGANIRGATRGDQELTCAMSSALTFARQHQPQPDRQRKRHRAVARDVAARSPLHVPLHPRLRRSARCKPSRAGMTCLALQASQHRPSQNVAFGYCTGAALLLNPRQSSPQIEQVRTSSPVTSLNAGASVARAVALRVRRRAIPRAVSG